MPLKYKSPSRYHTHLLRPYNVLNTPHSVLLCPKNFLGSFYLVCQASYHHNVYEGYTSTVCGDGEEDRRLHFFRWVLIVSIFKWREHWLWHSRFYDGWFVCKIIFCCIEINLPYRSGRLYKQDGCCAYWTSQTAHTKPGCHVSGWSAFRTIQRHLGRLR